MHGYPCEICHHLIAIRFKDELRCLRWKGVRRAAGEELCVSVTYIVVGVLLLAFLGVTVWL